ncbi:MAG: aminotransferase class I/II-fold pyridoxal phosphate-dependent enzyme [Bacteroidaceae bacterium]|nr:aminotransferase class I/II-fold pyridoxal phosphate-dependent enzyme [Bacteroidaceae bacterium]
MSYVPEKTIYLCLAHMSEEGYEQKYVKEAFDTNWVVPLGPNVNAFEEDLRNFVSPASEGEVRNTEVVALSAGTAAVHLALLACGVGPGDEVIVQSFTFCASSHPITYLGAQPVFVDSEPETWNMDPALLEEAIKDRIAKTGRKPKAIVPVALYGMPYDATRIMEIANRYGIPVVEDAAEGFGSRFDGRVLGTFGQFGVLSFNGNKMITTSGGGALVCRNAEDKNTIMWYATQARDAYPYYQHTAIGYNYRMSNICAGIGRGQMTVLEAHIAHHKHVQALYEELLKDVKGIHLHKQPADPRYDSNFWLCTATIDPDVKVVGQENAYKEVIKTAVGGAAGVIKAVDSATTDCQPNDNVEALRVFMLSKKIEARPVWKPMHKQPVYAGAPAYVNGVSESIFKVGFCLPAGPYVTDDDVRYIVDCIKEAIA